MVNRGRGREGEGEERERGGGEESLCMTCSSIAKLASLTLCVMFLLTYPTTTKRENIH